MRHDPWLAVLLVAFVLVCAVWGARSVVHLDAVPLELALEHQDLRLHQPQPPGYILHVWIAEIVHAFTRHALLSLRVASLGLLAAAGFFLYRLALLVADRATARRALLLFLTSPLVLFHGMTSGPYAGEALAATAVAYSTARAWQRRTRDLRFVSYLLGLLAGLRPTTLITTLPLVVWTGRALQIPRRSWLLALLAAFLGTLCWLVPQADLAGGLDDYFPIVWAVARPALQQGGLLGGPTALVHQLVLLASTLFWGFGAVRWLTTGGAVLLHRRGTGTQPPTAPDTAGATGDAAALPTTAFLACWILPPLVAALALGMRGTGYALALAPPLCLWLAIGWERRGALPASAVGRTLRTTAGLVLALDVAVFLFVSTPATRASGSGGRGVLDRLLVHTDFYFDRTRHADFEPLRAALLDLGPLAPATLVLGGPMTRAASILAPARDVVQFDSLRPARFLHYRDRHPALAPEPYVVPQEIAWILLEGDPAQIVRAPTLLPGSAPSLRAVPAGSRAFHLLPVGDGPIDLWFVPASADGMPRLHLVRDAPPTDPKLYERADAMARPAIPRGR